MAEGGLLVVVRFEAQFVSGEGVRRPWSVWERLLRAGLAVAPSVVGGGVDTCVQCSGDIIRTVQITSMAIPSAVVPLIKDSPIKDPLE